MARTVKQDLPSPPAIYDQAYIAQLAEAINRYMVQREAPAEVIAARFIMVDPVVKQTGIPALRIPDDVPDTTGLPTGMLYLAKPPGWVAGDPYFLTIVTEANK